MFKQILFATVALSSAGVMAFTEVPITGNVESKCVITTDTPGVFGNPVSNILSTKSIDGGVEPIVRFDIIEAGSYKAVLSYPIEFTTSPYLNDVVNWTGLIDIAEVSDTLMNDFDNTKVLYNNVTEYDLTVAGSIWFRSESQADYGYGKSFPGGIYRAAVSAECIAQ